MLWHTTALAGAPTIVLHTRLTLVAENPILTPPPAFRTLDSSEKMIAILGDRDDGHRRPKRKEIR